MQVGLKNFPTVEQMRESISVQGYYTIVTEDDDAHSVRGTSIESEDRGSVVFNITTSQGSTGKMEYTSGGAVLLLT